MPDAPSICAGASREIPVRRLPSKPKYPCPTCELSVGWDSEYHLLATGRKEYFIVLRPHRPRGRREERSFDWASYSSTQ